MLNNIGNWLKVLLKIKIINIKRCLHLHCATTYVALNHWYWKKNIIKYPFRYVIVFYKITNFKYWMHGYVTKNI